MATDGTGLKVIIPSLPVAHNGYIELYRNQQLAVFQYEADKSSEQVVAKLRPFHGTLTADAEHRFNTVFASGDVIEAGCNAHGRRKFRDAEETQPALAAEGGAFIGAMYGEEEKAQKLGLVGDALREHRQRLIRPIADDFERWIAAIAPTLLPSERDRSATPGGAANSTHARLMGNPSRPASRERKRRARAMRRPQPASDLLNASGVICWISRP